MPANVKTRQKCPMYLMHVFATENIFIRCRSVFFHVYISNFQLFEWNIVCGWGGGNVHACCVFLYFCTDLMLLAHPPTHTHRHRKVVKADTKQHRYTNVYVVCIDDYGVPLEVLCVERRQIPNCWNETCARASSWHSTWNEATGANLIITNNQKMYAVERSQFKYNFW